MPQFSVDDSRCIQCGVCVEDCIVEALSMGEGLPVMHKPEACFGCQHCLTVCPTAAITVQGKRPEDSLPLAGALPSFAQMRALALGRRSVRQYKQENVPAEVIEEVIRAASCAPTGVNDHRVRFTVVKTRVALERLMETLVTGLEDAAARKALPEGRRGAYMINAIRLWRGGRKDMVFRGAPHVVLTTAPKDAPCGPYDCCIALSYFELLAQARGLGTVWDGIFMAILTTLPQLRTHLGVPEDHDLGYAMAFGLPAVEYHRTVQREPSALHWVE
ncbi:nitroreductase family protein [Megalodesulfovibrio paquesii]